MDAETQAGLVREGGKLLSDLIRMGFAAHVKKTTTELEIEPPVSKPAVTGGSSGPPAPKPRFEMATTADTVAELKRRLGKELYRIELDLAGGGIINHKPCDCLDDKHHFGIEATAEELMSYDHNPVYGQLIAWYNQVSPSLSPAAISDRLEKIGEEKAKDFTRALIPTARAFRKQVMGTEDLRALLTADQLATVGAKAKETDRA